MEISGKTLGLLYELRDRLEERVSGIPAEAKNLPRYMPDGSEVKSLEDLATVLNTDLHVAEMYEKAVRRVRTAAGARQYGQPIGSIIRPDAPGYAGRRVPAPASRMARNSPSVMFPIRTDDPAAYRGAREGQPQPEADLDPRIAPAPSSAPSTPADKPSKAPKVGDAPGTRRRRKTDARPADPKDVPTGKAPASDDPLLRAANDAIYEATRLGVDQPILDELNWIREKIRTGSTWVGGITSDSTVRRARSQVRDGSTADVALIKFNDAIQRVDTPRKWSTVEVKPTKVDAPVSKAKVRDAKDRLKLTPAEKTQKAALDKTYRSTMRTLLAQAKAYAATGYEDDELGHKLQRLQNDVDKQKAQYKKMGWPTPTILRKATGSKKAPELLILSAKNKADYDALPNDVARKMYRTHRLNGGGHTDAVAKAMEHTPEFAKTLEMGRRGKDVIKVKPTVEGDEYTLRRTSAGQWYATYDDAGETIEVDPARYADAEYALAALEKWHEEFYRRLNAGKVRPTLPSASTLTLGRRSTENGLDFYKVIAKRGHEYWLVYDGAGWYSVKYDDDGNEIAVHDNYFADSTGALRFLEQADVESRRRKPKVAPKPSATNRVINAATLAKYERVVDVKKGDELATLDDGTIVGKQTELLSVFYRTVKMVRGNMVYFTDGTKAPKQASMYRVRINQTKDALSDALKLARLVLAESKDISTGSVGGAATSGFTPSADLRGRRPRRPVERRKRRALDRCRLLLRKKALRDVQAFVDLADEQKVRRVRTRAGADMYDQPIGSVIKPGTEEFPNAGGGGRSSNTGMSAKKPRTRAGSKLPTPRYQDDWVIYDIDILGSNYGISNDGNGWYSFFGPSERDTDGVYYDTPDDALDALVKWHATQKPKTRAGQAASGKKPKVKVGGKEYPFGTKLKAGIPPPAKRPLGEKKPWRPATEKDLERIRKEWGMFLPPAYTDPWVNQYEVDGEDDSAVLSGKAANGKRQTFYTPNHMERQKVGKFNRTAKGLNDRPKLEKALQKDAVSDDAAGMLVLMMRMGLRPDTSGGKQLGNVQTYGASTLTRSMVKVVGNKSTLTFTGKSGKNLVLTSSDPLVAKTLKARLDRGPDEQLFPVSEAKADAYLKRAMGGNYKMKDLRTMVGTEAALTFIAEKNYEAPTSLAALKKIKNEVGDHVAALLGNTRAVALASYIDPSIWDEWENSL